MAKQDRIPSVLMPHASTDSTRIKSAVVCGRGTRFGNGEENGREGGVQRSCDSSTPPLVRRWPCFIRVPLMASPEEVICGTPHPHSSVLLIGDVRVLIDRRTLVNVIITTRERRVPYLVNVDGPSLTAATWSGLRVLVSLYQVNCHSEHLTSAD